MTLPSVFGATNWQESLFLGLRLFESISGPLKIKNQEYNDFIPTPIDIHLEHFSHDTILRTSFNRIYYGLLQILINHYKVDRNAHVFDIHGHMRDIIITDPLIKQNFKKLFSFRVWADYSEDEFESKFEEIPVDNIIPQIRTKIERFLQMLIEKKYL